MARKKNSTKAIEEPVAEATEAVENTIDDVVKEETVVDEAVENLEENASEEIAEKSNEKAPKKSGGASKGLLALLLGGIAGVFASPHIAPYVPNSIGQYLAAGSTSEVEAAPVDLSGIEEAISQIDARIGAVETGLGEVSSTDVTAQIEELKASIANAPVAVMADGETIDLGPIQAELEALKAQNAELSSAIDEKLTTTVAEAETQVANAQKAEQSAAVSVALAKLRMSAENGRGMADDLQRLRDEGVEVPAELSGLSGGVDSNIVLETEFGDYAISAIRASVVASSGEQGGIFSGLTSQLSAQFAGRSTTPQEGSTPDAILSRSEDHLRNGDLEQSILELSALPSEALAEMQPWIERAENRLNVIAAIDALENSATGN